MEPRHQQLSYDGEEKLPSKAIGFPKETYQAPP